MRPYRVTIVLALMGLAATGCGGSQARRLVYESGQSLRQQECTRDLTVPCPERRGYDAYEKAREQSETPR